MPCVFSHPPRGSEGTLTDLDLDLDKNATCTSYVQTLRSPPLRAKLPTATPTPVSTSYPSPLGGTSEATACLFLLANRDARPPDRMISNSNARYSGADVTALSNVDSSGAVGDPQVTSVSSKGVGSSDGAVQQRSQRSLPSVYSKARSISNSHGSRVAGAQSEKSTSKHRSISSQGSRHSASGASSNASGGGAYASQEKSLRQIIEDVAEETGPGEFVGPANAGMGDWCDLPCSILPQLAWADPNKAPTVVGEDLANGDLEAPSVLSEEKEGADALNCDGDKVPTDDGMSHYKSECKFLKNSTIDARSVGEISEITNKWSRGFRPGTRWVRKPLKTNEEEEPATPGTDIDTI
ncbi:hypothetical protein THAOC_06094, partial [Thalassiosira oceanica]